MAIHLAAAITSFVISFLIVPVIIKYSLRRNLVDIPGRRKIHKKVTPSMGGIAIFCGFFISTLIWIEFQYWGEIKFILVALFVIFFIGVRDDLVPLRAMVKLLGQIMATCLLIFLFDLRLKGLYGLFGIYEFPDVVSYVLTIITVIAITNSFNLIDGLDGLAGTIASIALTCFGSWFFLIGEHIFAIFAFTMLGAILAFLIFNWEPSEVFMGDTGALVIGMTLAILTIHFINTNYNLPDGDPYKFRASIATAACFIMTPLVDTSRIIILRLIKRQSPFKPDKSHIHHAIMRLGKSHSQTTIILGVAQAFFVASAIVLKNASEWVVLSGVIITSMALSVFLDRLILKKL
ncbi:MAG TPA: MraY family glycosyltransferase [Chryseosolibacter sp.]|nr:MraY family glycosyltransferase [Chryseosolibacter sp.]